MIRPHFSMGLVTVLALWLAVASVVAVLASSAPPPQLGMSGEMVPDGGPPLAVGMTAQFHIDVSDHIQPCCLSNLVLQFTGLGSWATVGFPAVDTGHPVVDYGRNRCDDDFPSQRVHSGKTGIWIDVGTVSPPDCDVILFLGVRHTGQHTIVVRAYSAVWSNNGPRAGRQIPGALLRYTVTVTR